ncbi:MAG: diguanylate cyclase [Alphaproteobacteria bacterium]
MAGHVHLLYSDTTLGSALQRQLRTLFFHVTHGPLEPEELTASGMQSEGLEPEVIAVVRAAGWGSDQLRHLKRAFPRASLVLVDPIPSTHSQELALESGADGYLPLPATNKRLSLGLMAHVRRSRRLDDAGSTEHVLRLLGFEPSIFARPDTSMDESQIAVLHEDADFAHAIKARLDEEGFAAAVAPFEQGVEFIETAGLVVGAVSEAGWAKALRTIADIRSQPKCRILPITVASAVLTPAVESALERLDFEDLWLGAEPNRLLALMVKEQVRISRQTEHRKRALTQSLDLAIKDGLTDLYNRRYLAAHLPLQMQIARQSKRPLSLALFDLDGFKTLNDRYGHQAGDQFLIGFAKNLRRHSRASDSAVRLGGDEFALVLPNTDLAAARTVTERLIADIATIRHAGSDDKQIRISASAGLVTMPAGDWASTSDALVAVADSRLYAAKEKGGNQIVDTALL